ncbi:MAG: hypothetical protein QM752_00480 [Gammaproteobacteria bacterium]
MIEHNPEGHSITSAITAGLQRALAFRNRAHKSCVYSDAQQTLYDVGLGNYHFWGEIGRRQAVNLHLAIDDMLNHLKEQFRIHLNRKKLCELLQNKEFDGFFNEFFRVSGKPLKVEINRTSSETSQYSNLRNKILLLLGIGLIGVAAGIVLTDAEKNIKAIEKFLTTQMGDIPMYAILVAGVVGVGLFTYACKKIRDKLPKPNINSLTFDFQTTANPKLSKAEPLTIETDDQKNAENDTLILSEDYIKFAREDSQSPIDFIYTPSNSPRGSRSNSMCSEPLPDISTGLCIMK